MDVSLILHEMGRKARFAAKELALAGSDRKNAALKAMAQALREKCAAILEANAQDVKEGVAAKLTASLVERLTLNEARVEAMSRGIEETVSYTHLTLPTRS